jgi:hypothetical protein
MSTQINNLGIVFPDTTVQTTAATASVLPAPGANGNLLTSDGTNWTSATPAVPPVATAATNLKNGVAGSLSYQSAADTTAFLNIGTVGQVLSVSAGGLPIWTTATGGGAPGTPLNSVQYNNAGAFAGSANLTYDGTKLTAVNDALISSLTVGQGLSSNKNGTAFGKDALKANTGIGNTAVGFESLLSNNLGTDNVALGSFTLNTATQVINCVAIGSNAARYITNVTSVTAVGFSAAANTKTGFITAIGANSLENNTTGTVNTALGANTLNANTTGSGNTAVGTFALQNSTGDNNVAVGNNSGSDIMTGQQNVILGGYTGMNGTLDISSSDNYIVLSDGSGNISQYSNTVTPQTNFVGKIESTGNAKINSVAVGQGLTSGVSSTAVGINALKLNTANSNTAVGFNAGAAITTGSDNTLIGANAGKLITTSIFNVFVGSGVGQNATGTRQTCVGAGALQNCTTGERNVGIGFAALLSITSGGSNTGIGTSALQASTGSFNTAVGNSAGISMTTGSNNTLMGGYTGFNAALDIRTLSNYIVLSDGLGNANLYIDNNKNTILAGTVRTAGYTVGTLPAGVVGMRAYVTDANATTFYSVVTSGGANVVPVFYNGANWVIA